MNNNLRWKEYYGGPFHTFSESAVPHQSSRRRGVWYRSAHVNPAAQSWIHRHAFWPSCMRISISPRLDTTDSSCCFFDSIPFRLWDSATY